MEKIISAINEAADARQKEPPIVRAADPVKVRKARKAATVRRLKETAAHPPQGPPESQSPPQGWKIAKPPKPGTLAYTVPEFCWLHNISVPHYFVLKRRGLTPVEMKLGTKILISVEAADGWRRQRTAASAAKATTTA